MSRRASSSGQQRRAHGASPAHAPTRVARPRSGLGTVAVLGGGNMGLALVRGLLEVGEGAATRILVSSREVSSLRERLAHLPVEIAGNNREAVAPADVVVLAVKPQILPQVLMEVRGHLRPGASVVSIAAGVPTSVLERSLGIEPEGVPSSIGVVRAMPNVAASVRASATAIARGRSCRPVDLERARRLLSAVGLVLEVDEELMDAVTGLSGTGPLYLFLILEGLSDAGVKVGLSRTVSSELAIQTLVGAAQLVRATGEHPAKLRDLVTSPGGTAITALHSLERSGLKAMLLDAVEAATKRSQELGAHWRPRERDPVPSDTEARPA